MDCRQAETLTHGYLDGELDLRGALELETHLGGCPACAQALRRHKALQTALRARAPRYAAPSGLRARLCAPATEGAPGSFVTRLRPLAAAFATLLLVVGGRALRVDRREASLADAAVSAHVRALASGRLADVASSEHHAVKPWFAGKLDFSPPVPELEAEGFPLVGGRLDELGGKPAAAVVYKRREHVVELLVWPSASGPSAPKARSIRGFHTLRWKQGDLALLAVSDLNEDELSRFAGIIRATSQSR